MTRTINWFLFAFSLLTITISSKEAPSDFRSKMLRDLEMIKQTFEVKYAPYEWKKSFADWELQNEIEAAKTQVIIHPGISLKDYHQILKNFFNSTRDYHVGVIFYSTESATLPFRVQGANGRYFLNWLQRGAVPATWALGDEVILFDGMTTEEAITQVKKTELGNNESLTDQGLAEIYLTRRLGSLGQHVPHGTITVVLKHKSSHKTEAYDLKWNYTPEKIVPGPAHESTLLTYGVNANGILDSPTQESVLPSSSLLHRSMTPYFEEALRQSYKALPAQGSEKNEGDAILIGSRNGFLPPLGKVFWQSDPKNSFHAYLYKNGKGKTIGYVRLPHYHFNTQDAKMFGEIIHLFEQRSDALVIDQMNNSGGFSFFMYAVASMLTSKALPLPPEQIALTQGDVSEAVENLELLEQEPSANSPPPIDDNVLGYPITAEVVACVKSFYQFIVSEWNQGKTITAPFWEYGMPAVQPHPKIRYTKPILILVNHLSFSCGDFFPAIMQDSKRAIVMGTRTAGAGGAVLQNRYYNHFGIANYTVTGSIAFRSDDNPIENLGVAPDKYYEITENDLQNNYGNFIKTINGAVDGMIKK